MRRLGHVSALGVVTALWAAPAQAADASSWNGDARASMRLIAGGERDASGALRAGVELKLAPGWKTYWRYPGDSGVAPRFDFLESANVKSVTVLWPAPHGFTDDGGQSIGYKSGVIFPLRIEPKDAARPVMLRLALDYAVCEKICVPAEGDAELALAGGASTLDGALAAAEAQVPKPAKLGEGNDLAITSVRREAGAGKPQVVVDVAVADNRDVALFAEGPAPEWALPIPTPIAGAPAGMRRFVFPLDGLPSGARADGATLTLTAVAGDRAIEVKARLD